MIILGESSFMWTWTGSEENDVNSHCSCLSIAEFNNRAYTSKTRRRETLSTSSLLFTSSTVLFVSSGYRGPSQIIYYLILGKEVPLRPLIGLLYAFLLVQNSLVAQLSGGWPVKLHGWWGASTKLPHYFHAWVQGKISGLAPTHFSFHRKGVCPQNTAFLPKQPTHLFSFLLYR